MPPFISNHISIGGGMSPDYFCGVCGSKLVNGDCRNCFSTRNALTEFEMEDD